MVGRPVGERHLQPRQPGRGLGQQLLLDLPRGGQVLGHAPLVLLQPAVEAGVLQRDGQRGGEGGDGVLVLRGEGVVAGALQVQDAHQPVLDEHRHRQLRAHGLVKHALDVARVELHVGHPQGLAQRRGGAADPFAQGEGGDRAHARSVAVDGELGLEQLALVVPQHDGEDVVVDEPLDPLRHPLEQLAAVQDRGELAAQLVQQRQGLGLLAQVLGHPRAVDGGGQLTGDRAEQGQLGGAEDARLGGAQVEHPDHPVLDLERQRQLGAGRVGGADVAGVVAHVLDQDRLAALGGDAHQALAEAEPPVLLHLRRVAAGVGEPELSAAGIQQQHAKVVVRHVPVQRVGHGGEPVAQLARALQRLDGGQQLGENRRRRHARAVLGLLARVGPVAHLPSLSSAVLPERKSAPGGSRRPPHTSDNSSPRRFLPSRRPAPGSCRGAAGAGG